MAEARLLRDVDSAGALANRRLDTWDEIASYLGVDRRTAIRYEELRGMPVHRIPGPGRSRVFAFTHELDDWRAPLEDQALGRPNPPSIIAFLRRTRTMVALAVLVSVGASLLLVLRGPAQSTIPPARVNFFTGSLEALDDRGRVLWAYRPTHPLYLTDGAPHQQRQIFRIADLNGDGGREVLTGYVMVMGPNPDDAKHSELDCFSADGKLVWSFSPNPDYQFGQHELGGGWLITDLLVSPKPGSGESSVWASFSNGVWGNTLVVQFDPRTGEAVHRFVNTGLIHKLQQVRMGKGSYLLAGGFNNESDSAALAVIDEFKPFAVSPQTPGTRHFCANCPPGSPDFYFEFPKPELSATVHEHLDSVAGIRVEGNEIVAEQSALINRGSDAHRSWRLQLQPSPHIVSVRYDSTYDMMHRELESKKILNHTLETCPERLHPAPVRVWTPKDGWQNLSVAPMKASD